jgi:hypothetical protein
LTLSAHGSNFKDLHFLLIDIVFFIVPVRNADDKTMAKNAVYAELPGRAGNLFNISYDRIVFVNGRSKISTGLGVQYFPSSDLADNLPFQRIAANKLAARNHTSL